MSKQVRIRTTSLFFAALALRVATAHADVPTLSGRWSASPLRTDWKIGDWGQACGPRPSGGGASGGSVFVTSNASGKELVIGFPGRTYSTTECWEQLPGLARVSHSGAARAWQNKCKTNSNDPRQASLVTTISATDTQINFDETGQYQFVIQGQNCTASVRRTRSLTLVHRDGDPETPPIASSEPAPTALPRKTTREMRCQTTGLPERLEVRPSRKLMRPSEEFTFRASVLDALNCPLAITPTWAVVSGGSSVQLTGQGKIKISDSAPEGDARLQATVADRSVSVEVEIVSRERYDALLQRGDFNAEGESSEAAVARIASSSIGARASVARDEAHDKKVAFVAVVGGLSLSLGVLGLFIVLRGRRRAAAPTPLAPSAPDEARRAGPRSGAKVCPTCREEYPGEAEFCATDGNRLITLSSEGGVAPTGGVCPVCGQGYDPGVSVCPKHQEPLVPVLALPERRRSSGIGRKICPMCGSQFPGDSQFCGKCGAALVPVN